MKSAILKNMEALFLAALVIVGMTNYAVAKMPAYHAAPAAVAQDDGQLHTVVVAAKRLPRPQV